MACGHPFHTGTPPVSYYTSMGADGFEAIVAAHHGELYRYLRRATGRASEADDLSQETFLRAFRAYRSLPPDANVRAWLFAIATNLCRNRHRAGKRQRRALEAVRAEPSDVDRQGPEAETLFNETRTRIEAIVADLPLKQRLAFTLRKIHGLDYEAIARSLGSSPESARANVFQALRKIRKGLNRNEMIHRGPQR